MINLKKLEDADLVSLAKEQLPYITSAYEILMRRHQAGLLNFCVRFLGSVAEGEDACQEVMLKAYHAMPRYRQDAKFRTWLFQVARNECLDRIRKYRKEIQRHDDIEDEAAEQNVSPEAILSTEQELKRLLRSLTENEKEIFLLRYLGEFEFGEIAKITGLGTSAVKMRCIRTMEKLRKKL
ncbi:MAG: RNA polymerase sigma-70 factor (ECF subfamily) [Gammaproteobacteria bacterium]|jgi:RNA polymerase sigma-70 factor (ECF subfamily)